MRRIITSTAVTAILAVGMIGAAGPAQAAVPGCPPAGAATLADGTFTITNRVNDSSRRTGLEVGCVTTRHHPNGAAELIGVVTSDGWSSRVKASGGTSDGDRVIVEFSHTSGSKTTYKIERGRLTIR